MKWKEYKVYLNQAELITAHLELDYVRRINLNGVIAKILINNTDFTTRVIDIVKAIEHGSNKNRNS